MPFIAKTKPKTIMINLLHGDCLEQMKTLSDNSVDSIVSDPPYGISFMAKKWDYDVPSVEVWKEAIRVLKPGGHALIACGTRTQHRMVVNIEDAGFEIRDVVSWIYGSGFPKSLNISKAIDKAAGAEREKVPNPRAKQQTAAIGTNVLGDYNACDTISPTPATDEAKQWDGWGTALKPACEFFTLARKPLSEKTIAKNVLKWGTGGINIDGCRVGTDTLPAQKAGQAKIGTFERQDMVTPERQGRFPANLIHDGSQEVLDLFPETKSGKISKHHKLAQKSSFQGSGETTGLESYGDQGSAARFFKNIKLGSNGDDCQIESAPRASTSEDSKVVVEGQDNENEEMRNSGGFNFKAFYCPKASKKDRDEGNNHPTVKPTALMAYLCRLITPTGGTVLDPYMGSGSTGKAAAQEGFSFVGCELDKEYYQIAKARIENAFYV